MISDFEKKKERLESLKNGKGIAYILNESYEILGNPIVMFDTSYNLLACVDGIVTDDWLWNEITTLGTFSHETVDFFNTENFIEAYAQADVVALMKSDKLKYDRVEGKLFDKDGVQLGNINVVSCMKPFEDGDMELIGILCEILSVELQNSEFYKKIDRVYQESLLSNLLDGKIQDNEIVKAKIAELYEELKTNLYLAIADITKYDHTLTHLAYFRDLFKKIQAEYKYYIHLNDIVIIISTDNTMLNIKNDLSKLNEFFIKYKIYAGISSGFQDLLKLREYYREAINALNYGLNGKGLQHIFKYDDIRIEHFLNSVKNTADMSQIYSQVIFSLQEYDKKNNTTLLELLYTYLLYGKDTRLTCEKMGLTRSNLYRQLKKLEDIFEIDFKNGNMLSNIFISIKMLNICI